jgi:hypothetical protein
LRLPSYACIDATISFHSGGIHGSYVHSKCGFGTGLSQNGCGLALVACSSPSGLSITRSLTLIFDDVGWQYITFGSSYCAFLSLIGDSCSFIAVSVLPAVALFVFVGGISPPSGMSLHSSSGNRSACAPSGREGLFHCASSSGTSSMLARCCGPCSYSLALSVARYRRNRPSVSLIMTLVALIATPFTITWLFSKSSRTLLALIYGVPIIML